MAFLVVVPSVLMLVNDTKEYNMKQFLYILILFSLCLTATAQTVSETNGTQIAAIRGLSGKISKEIVQSEHRGLSM